MNLTNAHFVFSLPRLSQEKVACVRVDVSPDTPGGGSAAEAFLWSKGGPHPPFLTLLLYTTLDPADRHHLGGKVGYFTACGVPSSRAKRALPMDVESSSTVVRRRLPWCTADVSEEWRNPAVTAHRRSLFRNSSKHVTHWNHTCQRNGPHWWGSWTESNFNLLYILFHVISVIVLAAPGFILWF